MAHIYLLHGGMVFLERVIGINSLEQLWLPLGGHECSWELRARRLDFYVSLNSYWLYCILVCGLRLDKKFKVKSL